MISSQFIQSCQSGDEKAIQNLVQTYQRAVFQLALSIIDDGWIDPAAAAGAAKDASFETSAVDVASAEAEAATRETFVAAVDQIGRYREGSSFEHWLYTIAIQVSRKRASRWKFRRATAGALRRLWSAIIGQFSSPANGMPEEHLLTSPEPQAAAQAGGQSRVLQPGDRAHIHPGDAELWDAVRRLDEKLRIPIVLRYYHDYPIAEIAQLLRISEGSVHARLDSAREKIAKGMEKKAVNE